MTDTPDPAPAPSPARDLPAGEPAPPAPTFETDRNWQNVRVMLLGVAAFGVGRVSSEPVTVAAMLAGAGAAITFLLTWLYGLKKLHKLHFGSRP